ncbi:unnamed protein product [Linum trigynum]|uniref:Uncharacterized protein n=1 Tax=Linum trigynum TaxID=586398 RepID=A0AAV2E9L5_9ROSI
MASKVERQQKNKLRRRYLPPSNAPRPRVPTTPNPRPGMPKSKIPKPAAKVKAPKERQASSSGGIQCFKCRGRGHIAS